MFFSEALVSSCFGGRKKNTHKMIPAYRGNPVANDFQITKGLPNKVYQFL
jgi:hypothetical protein